jgi:hypothetical protein
MATVTPNFNWPVPTSTDLVKDGATAIEALGDSIDASLVDLKGGSTGQVLSKTTGTDMDFTWVTTDDANAIQNSIVDAKGDLISATANDTPARLAVGANGETLVADSSTSTGLRYTGLFGANKNKIINGDFSINQRSFSSTTTHTAYGFDRWAIAYSSGTATYSSQAFTPGAAPVAGYEGVNSARVVTASQTGTGAFAYLRQPIEDVRSFAGQTITVSFFAKASTGTPLVGISVEQGFGSGGSSLVTTATTPVTISASWARYSVTIAIPSVSGKTIGAGSSLTLGLMTSAGTAVSGAGYPAVGVQNITVDFWGVQAEAGSIATPFQTATGTIQGELAACQRYYYRATADGVYTLYANGLSENVDNVAFLLQMPVPMRAKPATLDHSNLAVYDGATVTGTPISVVLNATNTSRDRAWITWAKSGLIAQRAYFLLANNTASSFIGVSAEL